jgi:DNA-binding protein
MYKDNIVYVGRKDPISYVMAIMRTLNQGEGEGVILKARGRAISTAVDVAEITRNRFLTTLVEPSIEIETENLPSHDGSTRNVSSISIHLKEKKVEDVKTTQRFDLSQISGVGSVTEEKLKLAGFDTLEVITEAERDILAEKTGLSDKIAENIIESAKSLSESIQSRTWI